MHTFDDLVRAYRAQLTLPWRADAPAAVRVWMLWHSPTLQARLSGGWHTFEHATREAEKAWRPVDLTTAFAEWVARHEFHDALLEAPDELTGLLHELEDEVATAVGAALDDADEATVTALSGAGSLYGLVSLASLLDRVATRVRGRLLVAFPGTYTNGIYRLLDARSGWNYHAVPIPPAPL